MNMARIESLYLDHFEEIRGFMAHKIQDADAAHELAQEAFIKLMDYWEKHGEPEHPRAFLFSVAKNLLVDDLRRIRQGNQRYLGEASRLDSPFTPPDDEGELSFDVPHHGWMDANQKIDWSIVERHMGILSARDRHMFELRFRENMKPRIIAMVYGVTPNIVSVALHRARKKIAASLEKKKGPYFVPADPPKRARRVNAPVDFEAERRKRAYLKKYHAQHG